MKISQFDDIDEVFDHLAREREEADKHVKPWQAALGPGDFFLRIADCGGEPVVIYGEIFESEYEEDREAHRDPAMKNYRLSRCASEVCPEPEIGDVHVASIVRQISKDEFDRARKLGWPSSMSGLKSVLGL